MRAGGSGENTVAALMREQGLAARRKKKRKSTTRPGRGRWRAPDLVERDFPASQLNRKWYGDGTKIRTGEGKLYLDSVLDIASRRVLGFALGEHHDSPLAYGALAMAIAVRGGLVPGVIFHTDQGSEFLQGLTALRGLHLDRTCAPAVTWQLTEAGQSKISSIEVFTLPGEPRAAAAGAHGRVSCASLVGLPV